MGKSRRRSRSTSGSNYPYSAGRVAHIHVVRPKTRRTTDSGLFIGLFMDHPGAGPSSHAAAGAALPRTPSLRRLSSASLKRLDFVRAYTESAWARAAQVYRGTRQALVPPALDASLAAVERRVGRLGSPLLHRSEHILHTLDGTVDTALTVVHSMLTWKGLEEALSARRQSHEASLSRAATARAAYLHAVKAKGEEAEAFLSKLNGGKKEAKAAKKALAALSAAVKDGLEAALSPNADVATARVRTAWAKLAATPPASALLEASQPALDAAWRACLEAHDVAAASSAYTRTLEAANSVVHKVTRSVMYRAAVEKLYPRISHLSDPLLDKVTHSPYYLSVVDFSAPPSRRSSSSLVANGRPPWEMLTCPR